MASQGGGQQRVVHQDYMVRQRYSNALPPPPGDPKLLPVPQPGLSQYTMPHYASRMAREQNLNIMADAMLGMDVDPVGLPGYFDGDESAIQAPINPPPPHPRDKNLLRPIKSLGKPKGDINDVSFVRRTQYTAEDRALRPDRSANSTPKRRSSEDKDKAKDDPVHILRTVIKSFDLANPESVYTGQDDGANVRGFVPTKAELDAWKNPVHPTKPHLKMVDSYPLIPDLGVATDEHGFAILSIRGNPTDTTDRPDPRMQHVLLHPLEPSGQLAAEYQAKVTAHKSDPNKNPPPGRIPLSYEIFLAKDDQTANNMARKFDINEPDKDNSDLYTHASEGGENDSFRYSHARVYETGHQVDHQSDTYQQMAVAVYDPVLEKKKAAQEGREPVLVEGRQKAAYYYPVTHVTQLKPRRAINLSQMGMSQAAAEDEDEKIDNLDVRVRDADDEEEERRVKFTEALDVRDS